MMVPLWTTLLPIWYFSTPSSLWYIIESCYDHEFYLSKRLGMSPEAYGHLLVAANLAQLQLSWCFSIKIRGQSCSKVVDFQHVTEAVWYMRRWNKCNTHNPSLRLNFSLLFVLSFRHVPFVGTDTPQKLTPSKPLTGIGIVIDPSSWIHKNELPQNKSIMVEMAIAINVLVRC